MNVSGLPWLVSSIAAGTLLGLAWLVPNTIASVVLGWLAVVGLVATVRSTRPLFGSYLAGCVAIPVGFYWIPGTVSDFGGFAAIPAYAVFLLFIAGTAVQFLLFAYLTRIIARAQALYSLAPALAWLATEVLWIRIFPWEFAHTQLAFTSFIQIAALGGTAAITFLLFWLATAAYDAERSRKLTPSLVLSCICVLVTLVYGVTQKKHYRNLTAPSQDIAIVQANISIVEKHNIKMFRDNTEQYAAITRQIAEQNRSDYIAFWPESVIQEWVPAAIGNANRTRYIPKLPAHVTLVTGSLTYDEHKNRFNSAIAILADRTVPQPYHKRILMPFGEYMPGADIFPWIQELNPMAGGFTAGTVQTVFRLPVGSDKERQIVRIAPLICYEDIVPALSRIATLNGAHVLVNLTNDAWFGKTHASRQHHIIAAFRAVENGRFLVRSTNTGLTSLINPLGQTVAQLPVYSEGSILAEVLLLEKLTTYTRFVGNIPRYLILLLIACIIVFQRKEKPA